MNCLHRLILVPFWSPARLGGIGGVVVAFAAVAAWLTARTSNRTVKSLADLERQRRQAELIPQFVFGLNRPAGGGIATGQWWIGLYGEAPVRVCPVTQRRHGRWLGRVAPAPRAKNPNNN